MSKLTFNNWKENAYIFEVDHMYKGALSVIEWAYKEYGDDLVYACSFGIEGIVLIDLISKIKENATIVFLDTGLHFDETYELIEQVQQNYPKLNIILKKPQLTVEQQNEKYGDRLWESKPNRCCFYRKVQPLEEVLHDAVAWLSGLRREQSPTRKHTQFINIDENFQSIKVCPLIHWTWKDIWQYVKEHQLTYHPLHDQGYPSIGCAPCTFKGDMETGSRSGRWKNQGKTECGLHIKIEEEEK